MRAATESTAKLPPESETIRRAQQGDRAAFEQLYRKHSRRVFALCLRMSGNVSEAEDLTQDAFLTLFRKIQSFRGDSAFSTWLHRVTVNTVLMRFRKMNLPVESLDEACDRSEADLKPRLQLGERDLRLSGVLDRVILERAINRLAPGCKEMFILHDVAGYLHEEIAEIASCSVGNSKSQLHKARIRLREILCDEVRGAARTSAAARASASRSAHEREHHSKTIGGIKHRKLVLGTAPAA
jgi:RNA polymerase sigma-70 factor (ECF subfamily)